MSCRHSTFGFRFGRAATQAHNRRLQFKQRDSQSHAQPHKHGDNLRDSRGNGEGDTFADRQADIEVQK